jgi:hypothetical protein
VEKQLMVGSQGFSQPSWLLEYSLQLSVPHSAYASQLLPFLFEELQLPFPILLSVVLRLL